MKTIIMFAVLTVSLGSSLASAQSLPAPQPTPRAGQPAEGAKVGTGARKASRARPAAKPSESPSSSRAASTTVSTAASSPSSSAYLSASDVSALEQTSLQIKQDLPLMADSTLRCDQAVVTETLPAIRLNFAERGLEEGEAIEAAMDAWIAVRSDSPLQLNKCMAQASYQKYVTDLGKLVFRTNPDEALIEVSGKPLNRRTNYKKWYEPKTYNVKYTKEGSLPVEKPCKVVKSRVTDCFAELPPAQ